MKYLSIIFILLFSHIANVHALQHIPGHRPEYNFQIIQPHEVASNYQILKLADEILRKNQITYWAWGGTLLGAVRHQGFIPWDFDTDICLFEEDRDRLLSCAEKFKKYDAYILPIHENEYRIKRRKNGQDIYGHVDVFFMKRIDDRLHYIVGDKHYFFYSEVSQLIRLAFGPIYIDAPADYMPCLIRGYGKDVMEMAEIMYTANPYTGVDYPKFKITNFKPAIYEEIDHSIPLNNTPLFP